MKTKLINVNSLFNQLHSKKEKNKLIEKLSTAIDNHPQAIQILKLMEICDQILKPTCEALPAELLHLVLSHLNPEGTAEGQKRMQGLARVSRLCKYLIGTFHHSYLIKTLPSVNKEKLLNLAGEPHRFFFMPHIDALKSGHSTTHTVIQNNGEFVLNIGQPSLSLPPRLYTLQNSNQMTVWDALTGEFKQTITMDKNYYWVPTLYSHCHEIIIEDGGGIYLHNTKKEKNCYIEIKNKNSLSNYKTCHQLKFFKDHIYFTDEKDSFFKINLNTLKTVYYSKQQLDCSKYQWGDTNPKQTYYNQIRVIQPIEWKEEEAILFGLTSGWIGIRFNHGKEKMFSGPYDHRSEIASIEVYENRVFSIAKEEKQLIIWDLETGKSLIKLETAADISCFKILDLEHVIIATTTGELMMIQVTSSSNGWNEECLWSKKYPTPIDRLEVYQNKLYVNSNSLDILTFE